MQFFCIDPKHSEQAKTPRVICSLWEFYGSKVFSKPVAPVAYKNKLTVSRRRYHSVLQTHCEGTFLAYVPLRSASEVKTGLRFLAPIRATGIILTPSGAVGVLFLIIPTPTYGTQYSWAY